MRKRQRRCPARPPRRPGRRAAEVTQRAENLRDALGSAARQYVAHHAWTVTVPTRGSVRIERSGYSTATLGGSAATRGTTLNLIGTGDTGKTVVYTDRELTRVLLDHYG